MSDQPEALRLADRLDFWGDKDDVREASSELRRQHDEIEKLRGEVARLTELHTLYQDKTERLKAERDALVTLQKVRYEIATGETRGEMAAHCREGDLYRIGDAILVWVNEGDIIASGQRIDAAKGGK